VKQAGVYVHFPYCPQKCPYCDFAVRVERVIPQESYTRAVLAELRMRAGELAGTRVVSVYFGGGTPSLWEPELLAGVMAALRASLDIEAEPEVTVEANPDAVRGLPGFRAAGVNRISLGAQSFAPAQLVALGRLHGAAQAEAAVGSARAAGFGNVSIDLIHGGPGQTAAMAGADAARAAALGAEHVSGYALTLTGLAVDVPMARAWRAGRLQLPDDEELAEMHASLRAALGAAGLRRYEISNFARPGFESRHNLLYWTGRAYLGLGASACGFDGRVRSANDRDPDRYMERVLAGELPEASREVPDRDMRLRERIFTGLRLVEGLDLAALEDELDQPVRSRFAPQIERLVADGLALVDGPRLRLTERGLDLHSEAAVRFF